ncbi:MAG: hypothetical protein HQL63_02660 [Magnetococcales bacterium]|nr:hypothetical protein [Magnetococcales bacterium]MBF0322792.1 hypothetical protein [Magnetococcales bacterium]
MIAQNSMMAASKGAAANSSLSLSTVATAQFIKEAGLGLGMGLGIGAFLAVGSAIVGWMIWRKYLRE